MQPTSNITGFIVEVRPAIDKTVSYSYDGKKSELKADETFIGYFGSMSGKRGDNSWQSANITRITKTDVNKFKYQAEAIFPMDEIKIKIIAKRGPDSNNIGLSAEFAKFDTWHAAD